MARVADELETLFRQVGKHHHQAFVDTDGVDPEWPLWYADWLMDRLPAVLGIDLTKSELVYLLVHLAKKQADEAPDTPWSRYYAEFFVTRYVQGDA